MKELWEFVRNIGLSVAVKLYMAFALMMLWDWFVTKALHVDEIGYWTMYGLLLIGGIVSQQGFELAHAHQWLRANKMLEACIPDEKKEATMHAIEIGTPSSTFQWIFADVMKVCSTTFFLVVGWGVHTFLV